MMIMLLQNCLLEDIKVLSWQFSDSSLLVVLREAGEMSRPVSRSSSVGSICPGGLSQRLRINLKDCEDLIRDRIIDPPGKIFQFYFKFPMNCIQEDLPSHPLIILPDNYLFFEVMESDLHLLLKYYISVIPMAKQVRYTNFQQEGPDVINILLGMIFKRQFFSVSRVCFGD
jgi:hypothetical protein